MSKLEQLIAEFCPHGVEYKALGDLVYLITKGTTPKAFETNGISFIKTEAFVGRSIDIGKISYINENEHNGYLKRSILQENDILFTIAGATIGKCAFVPKHILPANTNQALAIIRLNKKNSGKYIMYILQSQYMKKYIEFKVKGSAQPNLNLQQINEFLIPLPPLAVQEEIVKILDNFTELTAELTAELSARKKQYEYYRDSLLTFGDDVEYKALGEVCIQTQNVKWQQAENKIFKYIDLTSVSRLEHRIFETQNINATNAPSRAQQIVQTGDIIFATTRPTLQRCCSITKEYNGQICSTGFCILRPNINNISSRFLYHSITTARFQDYVMVNEKGASYPSISDREIKAFQIPIPPLAEQERIVTILDRFDTLCTDIRQGLPAEIEARKKQYEYYRDKLLSFEELSK